MGIHDRDYYRDDARGWGQSEFRATTTMIAVLVGTFVVQLFSAPGNRQLDPLLASGAFLYPSILSGEVWRLLTSFLVQPYNLFSVILGFLALYWFGSELEERYGPRRFVWLFVLSGLFVSGGKMLLGYLEIDAAKPTAGSAGPIFAMLTICALLQPTRQVLLIVIPVPLGLLVLGLLGLYTLQFVARPDGSRMEFAVPLLGAAFGSLYYKFADTGFTVSRERSRSEGARPKLTLRPIDPPADDIEPSDTPPDRGRASKPDEYLEARLEAVLEKISKSGKGSLTAEENAVLQKASEVYRQKGK